LEDGVGRARRARPFGVGGGSSIPMALQPRLPTSLSQHPCRSRDFTSTLRVLFDVHSRLRSLDIRTIISSPLVLVTLSFVLRQRLFVYQVLGPFAGNQKGVKARLK
jgi:hypothetical protein